MNVVWLLHFFVISCVCMLDFSHRFQLPEICCTLDLCNPLFSYFERLQLSCLWLLEIIWSVSHIEKNVHKPTMNSFHCFMHHLWLDSSIAASSNLWVHSDVVMEVLLLRLYYVYKKNIRRNNKSDILCQMFKHQSKTICGFEWADTLPLLVFSIDSIWICEFYFSIMLGIDNSCSSLPKRKK